MLSAKQDLLRKIIHCDIEAGLGKFGKDLGSQKPIRKLSHRSPALWSLRRRILAKSPAGGGIAALLWSALNGFSNYSPADHGGVVIPARRDRLFTDLLGKFLGPDTTYVHGPV
jgi:hypothetical protein